VRASRASPRACRRHVDHGADGCAGMVWNIVSDSATVSSEGPLGFHQLGQSEIEILCAAAGQKNVTRLDIAVDDAFFVSGVEGVGNSMQTRRNE